MKPEAQRIAIAEACGWKPHHEKGGTLHGEDFWEGWNPKGVFCLFEDLPDYLSDLNAMHEAEKVLTDEQWGDYYSVLEWVLSIENKSERHVKIKLIPAAAAQRAEAFLKTIGKWTTES